MTILGMTGTRHPLTDQQCAWLWDMIGNADTLHHGACVGADLAAHQAAVDNDIPVVVHPPTDEKLMMPFDLPCIEGSAWLKAKPYLDRNRDIVDASDEMIALPDGPERKGSGTWYTINYAMKRGIPVAICYPDGSVSYRPDDSFNEPTYDNIAW